jgi:GMP synthase (glutamine-hydrolysing)
MVILAHSPDCPNHVWRHARFPAWGIQGHPEVSKAQAVEWFAASRARLELDGADVASLQQAAVDAREADTMLQRFIQLSRSGELATA